MAEEESTEQTEAQKEYTLAEAADYLKISVPDFKYHYNIKKRLAPDRRIGRNVMFSQKTLNEFKAKHQAEGLTFDEAADYLSVPHSWVRDQYFVTGRLKAVGKRGKFWVFSKASLDALRPYIAESKLANKP